MTDSPGQSRRLQTPSRDSCVGQTYPSADAESDKQHDSKRFMPNTTHQTHVTSTATMIEPVTRTNDAIRRTLTNIYYYYDRRV